MRQLLMLEIVMMGLHRSVSLAQIHAGDNASFCVESLDVAGDFRGWHSVREHAIPGGERFGLHEFCLG